MPCAASAPALNARLIAAAIAVVESLFMLVSFRLKDGRALSQSRLREMLLVEPVYVFGRRVLGGVAQSGCKRTTDVNTIIRTGAHLCAGIHSRQRHVCCESGQDSPN